MGRTTRRQRSMRRRVGVALLEIVLAIAFLLVMTQLVLPWAVDTMSDGFVRQIDTQ